jgi:hypothetical protein
VLIDGLESADDEQRTPKADPMDVDEPGSGGRYPTSKLFQKNPPNTLQMLRTRKKLGSSHSKNASYWGIPQLQY